MEGLKLQEAAASSPTRQLAAQPLSLRSTPQALVLLARRHGWRCLYAGLSINYMKARAGAMPGLASARHTPKPIVCNMASSRALPCPQVVPSTAIGFSIYDWAKSALALPTNL